MFKIKPLRIFFNPNYLVIDNSSRMSPGVEGGGTVSAFEPFSALRMRGHVTNEIVLLEET
jgi:hypothetical protein